MQILIVDDRVPDPHFGAGFPRAYRMLLSFLQLGHKVHFLPTLRESVKELNVERLRSYGIEICDDIENLKGLGVGLAVLSRPHNVHYYLGAVRRHLPGCKVVYDTEALWYRRYDLQLAITGRLPGWAYRYDEIGMARQVDCCFVVNQTEKQILEANGVERVRVLGHALNCNYDGADFNGRQHALVVGGILEEDSSNEDGLWWYLQNAWPAVHNTVQCELRVTGKSHSQRLRTSAAAGLKLLGHVDDLLPLYQGCRIFVATTRFATGIPWKVHEAMAHGIPCLISKLLANQLGVTDGVEALVAASEEEAVEKSVRLYWNAPLWESIRQQAYRLVERDCDPEQFKTIIAATLAELGL